MTDEDFVKELSDMLDDMTPMQRALYIKALAECKELREISFPVISLIIEFYEVDERGLGYDYIRFIAGRANNSSCN